MLTLQHSSYAFRLVQTLAVTGEYPISSLPLLGNERVLKQLIRRLSLPEMFCNSHGEMVRTKLFVTNGKGREKSLRLYKGALPLLHWLHPGAYEYYMETSGTTTSPVMPPTVTGTTGWRKPWPSVPTLGWRCCPTTCPSSSRRRSARSRRTFPRSTWPGTSRKPFPERRRKHCSPGRWGRCSTPADATLCTTPGTPP